MPISHKHKAIFVHIPKTAGTSIERFLSIGAHCPHLFRSHRIFTKKGIRYAAQHFTSSMLKSHPAIKKHWDNYFKFSVVRHPYTRVLSEYFWCLGKTKDDLSFEIEHFNKWLHSYYEILNKDHKLSQTTYLFEANKLQVEQVFKFENLNEAVKVLKKRCKIKGKLHHAQKSSNKKDYFKELTSSHKQFIWELYKDDFKNFNYER